MSPAPDRIFPLVKVATGDYLLLGNDTRTLWRIWRYEEEFPEEGESTRLVSGWGAWRWTRHIAGSDPFDALDLNDLGQWEFWDGPFPSRAEAIADALRARP